MVVAAMGCLAACGGGGGGSGATNPDSPPPPTNGGPGDGAAMYRGNTTSIWLDEAEGSLWLVSPDDRQLVQLDPDNLAVRQTLPLAQSPASMAASGNYLVIAMSSSIQRFDLSTGQLEAPRPVPCGDPAGVVVSELADEAWIACVNDDRVVGISLEGDAYYRVIAVSRPAGIAWQGDSLYVSEEVGGGLHAFPTRDLARLRTWSPSSPDAQTGVGRRDTVTTGPRTSASQFSVLYASAAAQSPIGVYQLVENSGDRAREPEQGGYGSVFDGEPRVDARVWAACGNRYTRFDGGLNVFSGPAAIAHADGLLWVVNTYTRNVAVLRCETPPLAAAAAGELELVAHFAVGPGAAGIALSGDGRTAFIDNRFDYSVSRLELTETMLAVGNTLARPALTRTRDTGVLNLSRAARAGRNLFFDATNIHLTPSGIVSCASCHPRAGADGLNWFLHTVNVPRKFRNTAPAWAARIQAAPFHWDGDFNDAIELTEDTIRELMEGDALLIDTSAIAAYMNEVPAPAAPWQPAWRADTILRGEAIFNARCASCHAGTELTDGEARRVVPPSADADGATGLVDTPTLHAIRATAPYLHDGRAGNLRSVLTTHNPGDIHGQTSDLEDAALRDLLVFLGTL